jgi:hypothetical protein
MRTTSERVAEENVSYNTLPPDYYKKLLPPQTEGPVIRTAFVTTDTIRLKVETIKRLQELAGLGSSSWDDVILKLLDYYHNNNKE